MQVQATLPLSIVNINVDEIAFVIALNHSKQIRYHLINLGWVNQGSEEILSGLRVGEQVMQKVDALINEGDRVEPIVK